MPIIRREADQSARSVSDYNFSLSYDRRGGKGALRLKLPEEMGAGKKLTLIPVRSVSALPVREIGLSRKFIADS